VNEEIMNVCSASLVDWKLVEKTKSARGMWMVMVSGVVDVDRIGNGEKRMQNGGNWQPT
jgi:hypothetical protein